MTLENDSITFGKYKGMTLSRVLRDRAYCKWLVQQDWFQTNYVFLYNRVLEYDPLSYFIKKTNYDKENFITEYEYFNLVPVDELRIVLSPVDIECYKYYILIITEIRNKIYERIENEEENIWDIKAPSNWLKRFEKETGIQRTDFKDFIDSHELLNIPYIIERIKKEGGVQYNGANSFKIAKARSEAQELWWEKILKNRYGEDIGAQFKYDNCIFDFINITTKTIFECKLGLKDFDETQHNKYRAALKEYRIIYLISTDCVINIEQQVVYTSNVEKYKNYLISIPLMKDPNWFYSLIQKFDIVEVNDLPTLFGN
uniref:Uncharacterized protein n=1 Tax=viral metagenome TaxID=1070528 RepID=A0A6C0H2H3_9ZZZZ